MSAVTLQGQVALITGGTDGIGKESALRLAKRGAELILVGRNAEKGARAIADIHANVPDSRVAFWAYDLSRMAEVQKLADAITVPGKSLDMLIHSAGVMLPRRILTAEGLETVFAVQYLARFHLSQLLMPHLTEGARILSVSAAGTIPLRLDFNNLNGERFYHGVLALIHESVANDLFGLRFMTRFPNVRFYNYGPFYVRSGLFVAMPWWFKLATATFGRLVATTTQTASTDVVNLITSDRPSGMYSRHLKAIRPSGYRANPVIQDRLWTLSEQMVADALQKGAARN